MEKEIKDGLSDLREVVKFMKEEGVLKLQTSSCTMIEIHPAFMGRTESADPELSKRSDASEFPEDDKVARAQRAKRAMNELMGGI